MNLVIPSFVAYKRQSLVPTRIESWNSGYAITIRRSDSDSDNTGKVCRSRKQNYYHVYSYIFPFDPNVNSILNLHLKLRYPYKHNFNLPLSTTQTQKKSLRSFLCTSKHPSRDILVVEMSHDALDMGGGKIRQRVRRILSQ